MSGFAPSEICLQWITQCFWNYLDWIEICHCIATCVFLGPDYQVYVCLAIFKHLQQDILQHTQTQDLLVFLKEAALHGSRMSDYFGYMEILEQNYWPVLLRIMRNIRRQSTQTMEHTVYFYVLFLFKGDKDLIIFCVHNNIRFVNTQYYRSVLRVLNTIIYSSRYQLSWSEFIFFSLLLCKVVLGFPGGSNGEESACNAWDSGSIPGSGRSPGEGNGNPLQYSESSIPWTKEPGGLHFMGLQRVEHDWATNTPEAPSPFPLFVASPQIHCSFVKVLLWAQALTPISCSSLGFPLCVLRCTH